MSNAVLYFHPDAYDTTGAKLMGRHAAGESFMRGLLRYGDMPDHQFFNVGGTPRETAEGLIRRIYPTAKPLVWHNNRRTFRDLGLLHMPVPGIAGEAWSRRPMGDAAYAICGITHTTATTTVMQNISDLLMAPLYDYDALICTSDAVRASVEAQLTGVRDYLAAEYGPRRRAEPLRTTIPLGINTEDFRTTEADRKAWRERLDIPEDAIVALYVGRFSARAKMNPALMAQALEMAAQRTSKRIYWVNSGWTGTPEADAFHHDNSRALCPSVAYRHLDGRAADTRFSIWSVADFFISFSDNIQETFGLTPIEAMAAGLPCVVTDWNGYRDTVRGGEDGFRIATYAPRPGDGGDIAYAFANNSINYENYVGGAAQFTTIDFEAAAQAIVDLAENADLRRRMGASAQARARAVFDWAAIVPQYQALWAEQGARRRAATDRPLTSGNPFRPDPFTLFGGYPTRSLQPSWLVALPVGASWAQIESALSSPLASYSNLHRPTLELVSEVFARLSAEGPLTVAQIVEAFAPGQRPFIQRGLLWMARFRALVLTPQG